MAEHDTPRSYFDRMYEKRDPWGYETKWYEQRKYRLTLAALPRARYRRGFEPGCSLGVLTEGLGHRCDELLAGDLHPSCVAAAQERTSDQPGVRVRTLDVTTDWPLGSFDLIVISELAYYFADEHFDELVANVARSLVAGGDLVLVHWKGPTDYPRTGDQVHDHWGSDSRFSLIVGHHESAFRLDVLRRRS